MTITLICTGKTAEQYVHEGMRVYIERLKHYCKLQIRYIEQGRGTEIEICKREEATLLKEVSDKDYVILMDENGKELTSLEFAGFLAEHRNRATKHLVFVIGGAYGFSAAIYRRANARIALSKMTFPHQLVRIIFLEQLYRAFTILKGEKYHH